MKLPYNLLIFMLLFLPLLSSCKKNSSEVYSKAISDYLAECSKKSKNIIINSKNMKEYMILSGKPCWFILEKRDEYEKDLGIKSSVVRFGERSYNIDIVSKLNMNYNNSINNNNNFA